MELIEYGLWYYEEHWVSQDKEAFLERICIIADDFPNEGFDWICGEGVNDNDSVRKTKKV